MCRVVFQLYLSSVTKLYKNPSFVPILCPVHDKVFLAALAALYLVRFPNCGAGQGWIEFGGTQWPKRPRMLRMAQNGPRSPNWSKKKQIGTGWPKRPRMVQGGPESPRVAQKAQNIPKGPEWPERPRMAQNGPG